MLKKNARTLLGFALAVLLVSGCSLVSDQSQAETDNGSQATQKTQRSPKPRKLPAEPELPVAATVTNTEGWKVVVNTLEADGQGAATLVFTLTNTGSAKKSIRPAIGYLNNAYEAIYKGNYPGGVTLQDSEGYIYRPLKDSEDRCLCALMEHYLKPGESTTLFTTYRLSTDIRSVKVKVNGYGSTDNVSVEYP